MISSSAHRRRDVGLLHVYPIESNMRTGTVTAVASDSDLWSLDAFCSSLTSVSAATLRAYRSDLDSFVIWCERAELDSPIRVTRTTLRRYVGSLATRQ